MFCSQTRFFFLHTRTKPKERKKYIDFVSSKAASAHRPAASLSMLALPHRWSISHGDDPCYISHVQPPFLYWLWWEQTRPTGSLVSRWKKWKVQHLQKQSVAAKLSFLAARGWKQRPSLLRERKEEHSFKHPRAVGKNVSSFNFQSYASPPPPPRPNFNESFKNVPLCTSVTLRVHGARVKHAIHQNKINKSRVFLLETAGKKKKKRCLLPTCLWWQ